jgi:hypothetical protein
MHQNKGDALAGRLIGTLERERCGLMATLTTWFRGRVRPGQRRPRSRFGRSLHHPLDLRPATIQHDDFGWKPDFAPQIGLPLIPVRFDLFSLKLEVQSPDDLLAADRIDAAQDLVQLGLLPVVAFLGLRRADIEEQGQAADLPEQL